MSPTSFVLLLLYVQALEVLDVSERPPASERGTKLEAPIEDVHVTLYHMAILECVD